MKFIEEEKEKSIAEKFIEEAKKEAKKATCQRAMCGAVIVNDGEIIGRGFNSPPCDNEHERRCDIKKNEYDQKVTDKTCCVHAEQRAVMNALRDNPQKLKGSKLYFSRFYPDGEQRFLGGKIQLYCTICTKMMFDVGIEEFILPHQEGIVVYNREEYLKKSFEYGK
ncbi:hypothetical protein A3E89_02045 [Candidatus Campbellbacteria bacterium RIFCSPHIGHO2_12_FULL_35_10]|uniref:CMP/dCMP-type deaminase domain-containing protein n=1 Tax=Candidatus Campbellbacteria bacterium RIFCSPHIGHO2_12_FULL_35_10 TaxID=1797578 RepID=A0A1F5EQN9_9BACT|nr:MAG: hypothetical protein A3E89_02045 [Candidatus Campbellbacteria bacterium RIFCSPHIGHO2_12_FULL_35_10]